MKRQVVIIGGGPAGLTTALRLSEHGYAVTILEQDGKYGGRLARRDTYSDLDVLPTVLMGCHEATLALLRSLDTASRIAFLSDPAFEFVTAGRRPVRFRRPRIPAPWGTVLGLVAFRTLSLQDQWRFLAWIERTWERDPALPSDLDNHTAEAWFRSIGQSEKARHEAWTPLCRFLLGDDLKTVSASLFLNMLLHCFMSSHRHSRLAVPGESLGALLLDPALASLRRRGASLRTCAPVAQIHFAPRGVTGLGLTDGSTVDADWYVSAVSHRSLSSLLPERAVTRFSYFQQLSHLTDSAALTIHLRLNMPLRRPRVLLLAGRPYHWIVLRPDRDGRRLVASLVATGQPMLLEQEDKNLAELAMTDLDPILPGVRDVPVPEYHIVREPRAFLTVRPHTTALRPLQQSPFSNFFVAGAWTDTGLPATLDGAIYSGELCAKAIIARSRSLSGSG